VAVHVKDGHAVVLNVGDSRAYLRAPAGSVRQLRRDHSELQRLRDSGEVDADTSDASFYDALSDCLVADPQESDFAIHRATDAQCPLHWTVKICCLPTALDSQDLQRSVNASTRAPKGAISRADRSQLRTVFETTVRLECACTARSAFGARRSATSQANRHSFALRWPKNMLCSVAGFNSTSAVDAAKPNLPDFTGLLDQEVDRADGPAIPGAHGQNL